MTGTMEYRYNEGALSLFWHGKTIQQVRDEQYPGAKITKWGPTPIRSLRARVDYCQSYKLEMDGSGILCYLTEVP